MLTLLYSALAAPYQARAQRLDVQQYLTPQTGLSNPTTIEVRRDGSTLFVLGEDSLAFFELSVDTGALQYTSILRAGAGEMQGLTKLYHLAAAPTADHLYLSGQLGWTNELGHQLFSLAVIAIDIRNPSDPKVVDLDLLRLDPPPLGVPLVLSPDGRNLYAVSYSFPGSNHLTVFSRNSSSGTLEPLQELDFAGYLGFLDLEADPGGRHLYGLELAPGTPDTVRIFDRDTSTGQITGSRSLSEDAAVADLVAARDLELSHDGRLVYAALAGSPSRLLVFPRDEVTGELRTPKVVVAEGISVPGTSLGISSDDQMIYQCIRDVELLLYERRPGDSIELIQRVELPPSEFPLACQSVAPSPDGRFVYVTGYGTLGRFHRDRGSSSLDLEEVVLQGEGGLEWIRELGASRLSPDGEHLYVARDGVDLIVLSRVPGGSGELAPEPVLEFPSITREAIRDMAFSPDGGFLFIGTDEEIVSFLRDPENGAIDQLAQEGIGGGALVMSADGRFLYARSSEESVTVLRHLGESGDLRVVQEVVVPTGGPYERDGMVLSQDGGALYVTTASLVGALAVFLRDRTTGRIELDQEIVGEGCYEMADAGCVAVSRDGLHVYVAIGFFGGVNHFTREEAGGLLSFKACYGFSPSFYLSPDGHRGYGVNSGLTGSIVTEYDRDPRTGALATPRHIWQGPSLAISSVTVAGEERVMYLTGPQLVATLADPAITSPEVADFRFRVFIDTGPGPRLRGGSVDHCIPETVCVHGAVPGRAETLLRIVGPKPNGRLWPTLVKFSTSPIEIEIEQISTGNVRRYRLEGTSPGSGDLPGLFDREGFLPAGISTSSGPLRAEGQARALGLRPGLVVESPEFPDFRFQVRLTDTEGNELPTHMEIACFEETACLSGAVLGRSEVFLRIVGPKPNGRLWPNIVRTTTSTVEVWIEQLSSGKVNYYRLEGATPGSTDLTGLFDRQGFLP
ncbi:MAG TPA: beta-propeller fold lactonase family protein [Thermoanaerobaculia bacterium]|nr:beta-propeller fold lactonase family protein [Thermoanaerobaculia bacterium]